MSGRSFGGAVLLLVTAVVSVTAWKGTAQVIPAAPPPTAAATALPPAAPARGATTPVATGPAGSYQAKCAICHAPGANPGYLALKQLGQPEPDLLKRKDLDPDYVKTVVRNGIGQMPALTAGYVGERELDALAAYLAKRK